jgi:hypothetical protein
LFIYIKHGISRSKGEIVAEGEGTASNAIWAITFIIIIVGLIMGSLYFGGVLFGKQKKDIEVNVSVPAR